MSLTLVVTFECQSGMKDEDAKTYIVSVKRGPVNCHFRLALPLQVWCPDTPIRNYHRLPQRI